jgi:ATP-dependent DNA ligase
VPADQSRGRVERRGVLHEVKFDGYRLMVRRTPRNVRIKTRRGYDWTDRSPLIVGAANRMRATSFVRDGEGVILRQDGVSDFDRLHSRRHDNEEQLLGIDLLECDGEDLRLEPLDWREAALAKLLRRSLDCVRRWHRGRARLPARAGGIVSKRRDKPYEHGRSRMWLKIKNPASPAA